MYAEVGAQYRAIDDLRLRLLGLLPLATGTGIFVLTRSDETSPIVLAVTGLFGAVATISLFIYELHGIEKCAHYIHRGEQIENSFEIRGAFTERPHSFMGFVSEFLPAILIYPASLAGWTYVALSGLPEGAARAEVAASVSAVIWLVATSVAFMMVEVRERARPGEWLRQDADFAQRAKRANTQPAGPG